MSTKIRCDQHMLLLHRVAYDTACTQPATLPSAMISSSQFLATVQRIVEHNNVHSGATCLVCSVPTAGAHLKAGQGCFANLCTFQQQRLCFISYVKSVMKTSAALITADLPCCPFPGQSWSCTSDPVQQSHISVCFLRHTKK